jgi:glycerol dehydrogenase-like iron-containing ADH family enzyme
LGRILRIKLHNFIRRRQAVYLASLPNKELVNKLGVAISHITPYLRNLVSDETLLGVMAWLLGINKVPWVVASHHFHHESGRRADEFLVARAHTQFAQGL